MELQLSEFICIKGEKYNKYIYIWTKIFKNAMQTSYVFNEYTGNLFVNKMPIAFYKFHVLLPVWQYWKKMNMVLIKINYWNRS